MLRHWKPTRGLIALAFTIALVTSPRASSAQEIQLAQAGHQHHPGMVMPAKKDKAAPKKKTPNHRRSTRPRTNTAPPTLAHLRPEVRTKDTESGWEWVTETTAA